MTPELMLLDAILRESPAGTLWCADENVAGFVPSRFTGQVLSNRFDIVQHLSAQHASYHCRFSDFDLAAGTLPLQQVVFRIAKEKAVNLHIIRQAFSVLPTGGRLHLIGYKNEGIASLASMAGDCFPCSITPHRHKAQLFHMEIVSHEPVPCLDDDYQALQWLGESEDGFYSKPGIFGWNKVDAGSQLLMDTFSRHNTRTPAASVLDLGCGYGYLSLRAHALGFTRIDATDNNAAAVAACTANFRHRDINGDVFADNHAEHCRKHYDIVLCNPPFHQGFGHHKNLTETFAEQAALLLKPQGQAWFVVNQFIGIERIAARLYKKCELLDKTGGFKVFLFEKA